jgi:hypothetical protein
MRSSASDAFVLQGLLERDTGGVGRERAHRREVEQALRIGLRIPHLATQLRQACADEHHR